MAHDVVLYSGSLHLALHTQMHTSSGKVFYLKGGKGTQSVAQDTPKRKSARRMFL